MMWHFHTPLAFLLLPLPFILFYLQKKRRSAYKLSTGFALQGVPATWRTRMAAVVPFFWLIGHLLLITALARPQKGRTFREYQTKGIDIVLVLDCSGSMLSEDFKPKNRFFVAKAVLEEFIRARPHDRLGLVVFAGEAFTQCPLTLDHGILLTLLKRAHVGMMEDGTAIGNAVATAIARLRKSSAKSKVIILTTDGKNNRGEIDPLTAAEIAKTFGIKIYTVGVGIRGYAMMPVEDPLLGKRYVQVRVDIDEDTLKAMAQKTGGQYYRATDPEKLKEIYHTINALEKSTVKVKEYAEWRDHYPPLLFSGMVLVLGVVFVELAILRRFP